MSVPWWDTIPSISQCLHPFTDRHPVRMDGVVVGHQCRNCGYYGPPENGWPPKVTVTPKGEPGGRDS